MERFVDLRAAPFLPFQCLRLTAKILLRCLWRQEDLSLKNFWPTFGGDHRGTQRRGVPPNPPPPPLPLLTAQKCLRPFPPSNRSLEEGTGI